MEIKIKINLKEQSTSFPDEVVQPPLPPYLWRLYLIFHQPVILFSLKSFFFRVSMFLLMQIYISHSFEKYLFLYNICEFL